MTRWSYFDLLKPIVQRKLVDIVVNTSMYYMKIKQKHCRILDCLTLMKIFLYINYIQGVDYLCAQTLNDSTKTLFYVICE